MKFNYFKDKFLKR